MLQWPVREGLIALVAEMRAQSDEEWRLARLVYALQASAGVPNLEKPKQPVLLHYRPGE